MELLLVTNSWPLSTSHEFLDTEVVRLAERFDRIVIAPMRPQGPQVPDLPGVVSVDRSLAEHLVHTRFNRTRPSRLFTAAIRAVRPNVADLGITRADILADGRDPRWIRQFLLGRADSASVALWAAKRSAPDVAYTFWLGPATVGLRAAWPGTPLVSRAHGGDLYDHRFGWKSIPHQAAAIRAVDKLAIVSDDGLDHLVGKFPDVAAKAVVRRLGIPDLGGLAMCAGSGALRILSVSSIDANKRVSLIAEVVSRLGRYNSRVEWTHLGDGPGRTGLDLILAQRPANVNVSLRGQVPIAGVYRELLSGQHNVFINLSLSEGAPMSLMEAQCVGLPVVATAVGGTPEVAPDTWNELVSTQDSAAAVTEAVMRAFQRPDSERAERRHYWGQNFDAESNYSAWASELHGLSVDGRSSR